MTVTANYTSGSIKNIEMKKVSIQGVTKLYEEIRKELSLVTWPTKKEMFISVAVVGISVMLAASIFFAADYLLYNAVQLLIKL